MRKRDEEMLLLIRVIVASPLTSPMSGDHRDQKVLARTVADLIGT